MSCVKALCGVHHLSGDEFGVRLRAAHHRWNLLRHAFIGAGVSGQRSQNLPGQDAHKPPLPLVKIRCVTLHHRPGLHPDR